MHSGAKVSPSGIFKIPQLIAQVPRPNPQTHGFGLEEAEKKIILYRIRKELRIKNNKMTC